MEAYLKSLIPARSEEVQQLERYAEKNHIPIMDLIGMESLLQQLRLIQPKRILEIGTAIGYSAIRMALAFPDALVITIERDPDRYKEALTNISNLNLSDRIDVKLGEAFDLVQTLESEAPFDVLFIDAAKSQYKRFFNAFGPFVQGGGVIFSDNVLFRGFVGQKNIDNKRLQSLVNKIHSYNEWLMQHVEYETRILPLGDGLAVSIKKSVNKD